MQTRRRLLLAASAALLLPSRFAIAQARVIDATGFGVRGDGETDNAAALQAAADAVPDTGGTLRLPPGQFRIGTTLRLKSRTTLTGPGATILSDDRWQFPRAAAPPQPGSFTPTPRYVLVANRNFSATTITDTAIAVRDIGFAFTAGGEKRGDAHALSLRQVAGVSVSGVRFQGGGDGTAFLACRNTEVVNCSAQATRNCAFDHWEGTSDGVVRDCTAVCDTGYGILFTGVGTDRENHRDAARLSATNNRIESAGSAAIWVCSLSERSSVSDVVITGNTVVGGSLPAPGIGATGAVRRITMRANTVRGVHGGTPLFSLPDKWNRPSDIQIIDNQIADCTPSARGVALIPALGDTIVVEGNRARGGSYRSLVWIDGENVRLARNTGDGLNSRFKYNTGSARAPQIADPQP